MFKITKKAVFLLISAVFLVLLVGGFFYWEDIENYLEEKEMEKVFAPAKDYTIYENSEGKFIENKKDKLTIKIPDGWQAEIGADIFGFSSGRSVVIYSSDYSLSPRKGCAIEIEITRAKEDAEGFLERGVNEVKEDIVYSKETPANKENYQYYEVVSIRGRESLKEVLGNIVTIEIPTENNVYFFQTISIPKECLLELNNVLETAYIR
ncbi:MAG: hypothetical protein A2Z68_00925 [Candidatus Nealsonbacteria bacterium RBG_13_38_11]|uniref:PsbP C-terminal domain-containing protein n=1 Tax=Candidatus Nealsonbacteria bacterium RBG_13_38_11 TaxID=1801662 RepID=A0A1G2E1T1_9BACT|nr:MAG: hypothetical protein A2Z68_00925 [Candidatus Nealsonbacteria bacterium RBG_13_38_11]